MTERKVYFTVLGLLSIRALMKGRKSEKRRKDAFNAFIYFFQYSRNVSQTRWIIDDERMGEASVEVTSSSTIYTFSCVTIG